MRVCTYRRSGSIYVEDVPGGDDFSVPIENLETAVPLFSTPAKQLGM